jgi:AcrR family transcriptional regulator
MATRAASVPARRSEPRERLLAKASELFYADGIHRVGIERIIAEARVTKATFYRHFPSKQDLVLAYLETAHLSVVEQIDRVLSTSSSSADSLRRIADAVAGEILRPGFRGCAFINAAAEFPETDNPVHVAVIRHRAWYERVLRDLFVEVGADPAEGAARHVVMLRDGAMVAGYLSDRATAGQTLRRGIEGILEVTARQLSDKARAAEPSTRSPDTAR